MRSVFHSIVFSRSGTFSLRLLMALSATSSYAFDPFVHDALHANRSVAASPARDMLGNVANQPCALGGILDELDLPTAAEHALCANPKTREAWANVKVQAAQLGEAKAAYFPTLNGSVQVARDNTVSEVPGATFLNGWNDVHYSTETLSLGWLLYDFGARSAGVQQARRLLDAAQAGQDAAIQDVLITVVHDYYTASADEASLESAKQVEASTKDSLLAATERVKGGVAPVTDQLQAQTQYAQAVYNRVKAQGSYRTALGTLALDMGVSPSESFVLTAPGNPGQLVEQNSQSVDELLQTAQREHPALAQARAQLEAAQAKAKHVLAQGRPTLTLTSRLGHNNQPIAPSVGSPDIPAIGRDRYVGLELDIPFFEGFSRNYQFHEAEAQVELQQAQLSDAEQQVSQRVWESYQTLQTDIENVRNSAILLDSAQEAFEAAKHRYERGVGNILELLNAQTAYANAQQQRVQALADWRIGKLQLVGSLGKLTVQGIVR